MSTPKTEAKRAAAAQALAKKLDASAKAMQAFIRACVDDGQRHPYADDDRVTLMKRMEEYSAYAEAIHRNYQRQIGL